MSAYKRIQELQEDLNQLKNSFVSEPERMLTIDAIRQLDRSVQALDFSANQSVDSLSFYLKRIADALERLAGGPPKPEELPVNPWAAEEQATDSQPVSKGE